MTDGRWAKAGAAPLALVVTMGTDYLAPARMPYELARAGLRVGVLAPRDSLAARTAFANPVLHFPPDVTLFEWIVILGNACRAHDPALLLPGDDVTLRVMTGLVLEPPHGVSPLREGLRERIVASLGDPSHYLDSLDKTRLFDCACAHGVPVAPGGVACNEREALAIARSLGYPVIVRPAFGTAGSGTARCETDAELCGAVSSLPDADGGSPRQPSRCLVQRWVEGEVLSRASVAWHGEQVAGVTRARLETHPAPFGPGSVVEGVDDRMVTDATRALCRILGLHGFISTQWIRDRATGTPLLVEINRRMVAATYGARWSGVDLAGVLAALLAGERWPGPVDAPPGPGVRLALFPQEWYRDPASRWLETVPSDAPWHDPLLMEAMLRPG